MALGKNAIVRCSIIMVIMHRGACRLKGDSTPYDHAASD